MCDNWILTKLCMVEDEISGITVDNNGNIYYVTWDENIFLVSKDIFNTESQILINIEGAGLCGIVWNGNNILYICDWKNHKILSYSIDTGKISTLAGTGKKGYKDGSIKEAQFNDPTRIAMDKNGDLYITDWHCVRKINLSSGIVETIAGSIDEGHNDGEAKNAMFNYPTGITVSDDIIYVTNYDNHCIRSIKNGIVSTIAGIPGKVGYQDGPLSQSMFSYPLGLVLDIDENLLVGDNIGLRRIDMNQNIVSTLTMKLKDIMAVAKNNDGNIFIGSKHTIVQLENNTWRWERFLWIGWLKEGSSYCLLTCLPKEIIHEIAMHLHPNKGVIRKRTSKIFQEIESKKLKTT